LEDALHTIAVMEQKLLSQETEYYDKLIRALKREKGELETSHGKMSAQILELRKELEILETSRNQTHLHNTTPLQVRTHADRNHGRINFSWTKGFDRFELLVHNSDIPCVVWFFRTMSWTPGRRTPGAQLLRLHTRVALTQIPDLNLVRARPNRCREPEAWWRKDKRPNLPHFVSHESTNSTTHQSFKYIYRYWKWSLTFADNVQQMNWLVRRRESWKRRMISIHVKPIMLGLNLPSSPLSTEGRHNKNPLSRNGGANAK